jgi:hypothetical protein
MKTIFIIIGIVFSLTIYYFICQHRIRKTRRFQETAKEGDMCYVFYGEERHYGKVIYSRKPHVTVSFDSTGDYPYDDKDHKIIAKNYQRENIYPA